PPAGLDQASQASVGAAVERADGAAAAHNQLAVPQVDLGGAAGEVELLSLENGAAGRCEAHRAAAGERQRCERCDAAVERHRAGIGEISVFGEIRVGDVQGADVVDVAAIGDAVTAGIADVDGAVVGQAGGGDRVGDEVLHVGDEGRPGEILSRVVPV